VFFGPRRTFKKREKRGISRKLESNPPRGSQCKEGGHLPPEGKVRKAMSFLGVEAKKIHAGLKKKS